MPPSPTKVAMTLLDTRAAPAAELARLEDLRFVTGQGRYVDDIVLPGMVHGVVVQSPHAHARILSIDAQAALEAPGVLAVFTGADVQAEAFGGTPPLFMPEDMGVPTHSVRTRRPLLALDRVRFVGDRVAFVVAETLAQARDAAERLMVDYEPLPAVVTLDDATAEDAPQLWDEAPGNIGSRVEFGDENATRRAFDGAAHVVELRLENNRLTANPIEPRGALASFDAAEGLCTLYTSSQNPHGVRQTLASQVFHTPEISLRVISPDVGGAFGMKGDTYPEDGLVVWAAQRVGRPVKWIGTRGESIAGDNHGRDQVAHARMALDDQGRVLAVSLTAMHAFGAFAASATAAPLIFSTRFVPSVYDIGAYHGLNVGVFTNTAPTGPYRGAGRPEAAYVIERLMDAAAHELDLDPVEFRRRHLIRPAQMPYSTHTGFVYDSGDFPALLDRCLALSDAQGYDARRRESTGQGLMRGRGVIFFIEQGGVFNDQMGLRFDASGSLTILSGLHSHGQSHATVFTQLVSEWLGVPSSDIRYLQGDTDKVPFGRGTYAARSSMIGSCALRMAADRLVARAGPVAAMMMGVEAETVRFEKGRFCSAQADRTVSMQDTAKAFFLLGGPTTSLGAGLEAVGYWDTDPPNFPCGCHVCEVEVDPQTGVVRVDRYNAVDDVGHALNRMVCEGQIAGGVAQGIGQALLEHVVYDRDTGQLLTGSFMDYGMPRADDLPAFRLELAEFPCQTNPLGVKAVGEAGTIAAPPAVMNAVLDALRPLGVRHLDMPATPQRVWQAIQAARPARA